MPYTLIPAIEQRISTLLEVARRVEREVASDKAKAKPKMTVTISREFGCEAYPMAEQLKKLLDAKTGETWALMDKALLEEVSKNQNVAESILQNLGERGFVDDMIATLSPRWKSEKDHYRRLCQYIISLANVGNVIIVGRGGAIVTKSMGNCYHFRMVAPHDFKIRSISKRLSIPHKEAEELIQKRQQQRDTFINNFLSCDASDPTHYHLVFNNAKSTTDKIAETILCYLF